MATTDLPSLAGSCNDETYYWDSVCFVVESILFKVPRYPFTVLGSEPFTDILKGREVVTLCDVTAFEFRALLKLVFPDPLNLTFAQTNFTKDEWVAILKLSTLWSFKGLRKLAISHLELLVNDPIEQVLLGRVFYVPHWLLNGYAVLVTPSRPEPITEQESIAIGLLMAVRLYIIRHDLQSWDASRPFHDVVHEKLCLAFSEDVSLLEQRQSEHRTQDDLERQQRGAEEEADMESARKREEEERRKRETKVERRRSDEIKRRSQSSPKTLQAENLDPAIT